MWFECDSRVVHDCDITIHSQIVVWDFRSHLKFKRIAFASSIFGCAQRIFLFCVNVEPPYHLVVCEQTSDYSHRFLTVSTRQRQLQPLSNHLCEWRYRGTIGLHFSDWSKITFIFHIQSVARLWQCQRMISLEKKLKNVVFESITNVWLMYDPFETYIRSIYNPVIHVRPICNNVRPTCGSYMTHL